MNEQVIDIPTETWTDVSEEQLRVLLAKQGEGEAVPTVEAEEGGCPGPVDAD